MARKAKPNWVARAQTTKASRGGRLCSTCNQPEVASGIRIMCIERAEGRSEITYTGMSEVILEELGVFIKPGTLLAHVRNCLPELHRKIRDHEQKARD